MPSTSDKIKRAAHEYRNWIKWTVYTLLLLNFGYYIWEDWMVAAHSLRQGGTLFDWTASFANTLDETAWFLLLALFELETYAIPEEAFTPALERTLHAGRILCYVFLAHTILAYSANVVDLERKVSVLPEVESLCELVDQEISFTSTMDYTLIDEANCGGLSDASEFYQMVVPSVVTDARGLRIEKELGWVDLIEAMVWLLIVLTIEIEVRLQSRDIASGPLIRATDAAKVLLYSLLFLATVYWAFRGLWIYIWDEFVWIGGFAIIEMNVSEWRDELLEEGD
jgi:hypothetical protein